MMFAQQVIDGDRLNLGLKELAILAVVLIVVSLLTKPEAVLAHLRGMVGFKAKPIVEAEDAPLEFLELHAALTELSLEEGGVYNEPLAAMYKLYLDRGNDAKEE